MAQYFTDFSGDTISQPPSGLTVLTGGGATLGASVIDDGGVNVLQVQRSGTNQIPVGIFFDSVPSYTAAEIYAKIKLVFSGQGFYLATGFEPFAGTYVNYQAYLHGIEYNSARISELSDAQQGVGVLANSSFGSVVGNNIILLRAKITETHLYFKVWRDGDSEPLTWTHTTARTSLTGEGLGLLFLVNNWFNISALSYGTDGDPAPTSPVDPGDENTGELIDIANSTDTWSALCSASTHFDAAAFAADNLNAIASVNLSVISAAQAGDSTGDLPAALSALQSASLGNNSLNALVDAGAALTAGAAAGEAWSAQAQVVVNLLEQAAAADEVRRQAESAINAALSEESQAAVRFIASVNAIAPMNETATAIDAYVAIVAQLASIASSGAIVSDSFRILSGEQRSIHQDASASDHFSLSFGYAAALRSGALTGSAWALMVDMSVALSELCSADDLLTAKASVTGSVRAGALASGRFAVVNAGIRYLVIGAIILRDALNHRVTTRPALNQSVKIKPGN